MPATATRTTQIPFPSRAGYTCIPALTEDDLEWIASKLSKWNVVELGAGTGWLSDQLHQRGIKILATDLWLPRQNPYQLHRHHCYIKEISAKEAVTSYLNADCFLCSWPCYGESWAAEALASIPKGAEFLYIGQERDGLCANTEFFDILEENYNLLDALPATLLREKSVIQHYQRKS
jgi:hypothetical protein